MFQNILERGDRVSHLGEQGRRIMVLAVDLVFLVTMAVLVRGDGDGGGAETTSSTTSVSTTTTTASTTTTGFQNAE